MKFCMRGCCDTSYFPQITRFWQFSFRFSNSTTRKQNWLKAGRNIFQLRYAFRPGTNKFPIAQWTETESEIRILNSIPREIDWKGLKWRSYVIYCPVLCSIGHLFLSRFLRFVRTQSGVRSVIIFSWLLHAAFVHKHPSSSGSWIRCRRTITRKSTRSVLPSNELG